MLIPHYRPGLDGRMGEARTASMRCRQVGAYYRPGLDGRTGEARTASMRRRQVGALLPAGVG